jgi:predicted Zn-dependent protease
MPNFALASPSIRRRDTPSRAPHGALSRLTRRATAALCALAVGLTSVATPAHAQASSTQQALIRDTEIENLLRDYADPIFTAAGIKRGTVQIVLVGDRSFNAFVADGRRMFVNVGALMDAKTPSEIIGVIAHETGHIVGGHLSRLREQLANAQIMAVVGMLLGAGALVGAATSGGNRVGNPGTGVAGVMLGSQEMIRRSLLSYQRSEEQAADRMAVRFLDASRQSAKGLLDTFQRFNQDALFKSQGVDPYLVSHPLPAERIASMEELARRSPYFAVKDPPELQARHDMMRAKLFGFVAKAEEVGRRYPLSDASLPARYARAITAYRYKRLPEALAQIDGLMREQPSNPYFVELKGQVLLEFGRAQEAVPLLRKAAGMAPSSALIKILLGQALVATERPAAADEAIRELSNAVQREPESADGWQSLSQAYGIKGNVGMATYAAAQSYFVAGDYVNAATQASRAKDLLPPKSPGWLKADDILNTPPPKKN